MNTHDEIIRLFDKLEAVPAMDFAGRARYLHDLLAAIKLYQRRIEELESQLEAIGAGGVSSQRITSPSRSEPVAFAKDGNLFWRGDPVAWREFSGELYLAPQPAEPVKVPQPHEFNTGNEKLDALLDDTFYLAKDGGMDNAIKWQESLEEFLASIEPVKVPSDDERAGQGLPPYRPRHLTEEEWNRLTENGRRAWGKQPAEPTNKRSLSVAEPEKEPPCET